MAANEKVVLAFIKDVLAEHHGDHAAGYFTPDAQFHAGTLGTITGNTNIGGALNGIVTAVPDLHPALQDMFGQGNEVVVRLVVTGAQTGNLLGIPASGRPVPLERGRRLRLKGLGRPGMASEDLTRMLEQQGKLGPRSLKLVNEARRPTLASSAAALHKQPHSA